MKENDKPEKFIRSRGGRPLKRITKDSGIRVRLTKIEYFIIEQKAKHANMKISDWFRQAAKSAKISPRFNEEELKIFRMLTGMANNLNQLTKLSHQQGLLLFQMKCVKLIAVIDQLLSKTFKP